MIWKKGLRIELEDSDGVLRGVHKRETQAIGKEATGSEDLNVKYFKRNLRGQPCLNLTTETDVK